MPDEKANLMPPPIWHPPGEHFDKPELLMIREIFGKTNFPGNTCAAVGRFIAKCDRMIEQGDDCGPMPMMGEKKAD